MVFAKKIARIYAPFRLSMLGLFGFIAMSQALVLFNPFLQGKVVDSLVHSSPLKDTYFLIGATLVASLFRIVVVGYLREMYELKKIDFAISHHINHVTLARLLGFSIAQHVSENSGIKRSIISRGQHSLSSMTYTILYQVVPMLMEIIMLVGLLLLYSRPLGLIVLVTISIYAWLVVFINLKFKKDFKKMENLYNRNSKFQGEVIQNADLVLSNAQEHRAVKECDQSLGETQNFCQSVWLKFNNFAALRNALIALGGTAILTTAVQMVHDKQCSIGQMFMFLSWSGTAFGQISQVGNLHRQLIQMYSSVKKYFDMLDIEPDVKEIENPVRPDRFSGKIEFRNVTLSYKRRDTPDSTEEEEEKPLGSKEEVEKEPALKDVSFTIEPGQKVAFVGESGAGKSTIVYALVRAQDPDSGQVLIDGHDLRILDLKKYRESIGVVDQKVTLFDQSIRYNMTYGLNGRGNDVTEEDLHDIAEISAVNRFYHRLEKGFDTLIGERGVKLSGGECQRLGIARAMAKKPDVLIFDEATSNLDPGNEEMIRESISKSAKGRTTIIIAHRFCTIKDVDKVFVFDQGRIVGEGTHSELAQKCEAYKRLVKNQTF